MKLINCIQGSDEWFEARLGIPTASCFGRIAKRDGTSRTGQMPKTYRNQLIEEHFLRTIDDCPGNQWTVRANELEAEARANYALGVAMAGFGMEETMEVKEHGFCVSDCGRYGYSPDALVGEDGALEIKCPKGSTHIGYLLTHKVPDDYWLQCHGALVVTGRSWIDFMSYHPDLPELLVRIERSEVTETLQTTVEDFCDDLTTNIKKIESCQI